MRAIVSEKDIESYIRDFLLPLTEVKVITIMSSTPTFTVKNLRIRDNEAIYTDLTINMILDGLVKVSTTSCKIDSICSEYRKLEKKLNLIRLKDGNNYEIIKYIISISITYPNCRFD